MTSICLFIIARDSCNWIIACNISSFCIIEGRGTIATTIWNPQLLTYMQKQRSLIKKKQFSKSPVLYCDSY